MIHRFGPLEIDEDRRELRAGGRTRQLQPRVFDLLAFLARHRDRVVPKDELLDGVWAGVVVADGSLQRAVSLARAALLQLGGGATIRTYSRNGYRLCADEPAEGTPSATPAPEPEPLWRSGAAADGWTVEEQLLIRAEVDAVAQSPALRASPGLESLLRLLMSCRVAGRVAPLTPEAVGAQLHPDRPPAEASLRVRLDAGELRVRLREHYAGAGRDAVVQFGLRGASLVPWLRVRERTLEPPDGAARQEVRFLRSRDGTSIAYAVSGLGRPLVKAANWLSHLEYDHQSPVWRHWWRELSDRYQLIRYDERGCGLSERDPTRYTLAAWVEDLEAVVDAAGLERFPLLGISQGAAVAISYAVRHPERVTHLVLYGGFAQGRMKRPRTLQQTREALMLLRLTRLGWGRADSAFAKVFAALFMPAATPEQQRAFVDLQHASCPAENAERFIRAFGDIDVADLASQVRCPTLVLHAREEQEIPLDQARLLASRIPHARLTLLDSQNHILAADEPAWPEFLRELDTFLG